jgi:sRNA-binding regulator protein Hfq
VVVTLIPIPAVTRRAPSMAQASKLFDLSERMAAAVQPSSTEPRFFPKPPAVSPHDRDAPLPPRKLVRPTLPANMVGIATAPRRLRGSAPLARHEGHANGARKHIAAASHAEALYYQKQMQTQTPLVFVLEDGEQIEGIVEWFDRDSVKIRNATRTLIFKRRIKYLYKAKEDGAS